MSDQTKTYRVFELNRAIKEIIETSCPYPIWVQGEIGDFDKNTQRTNIYFQLSEKDRQKNETLSSIRCVLYESRKSRLRHRLQEAGIRVKGMDGIEVRLQVRLSVSARSGSYLLTVEDIDPAFTLGQLAQNRQRIIDSLTKQGLMEKNKKLDLPLVPLKIALITNEGEGYHDFIAKLQESGFGFQVSFFQANVQGPQTERDIRTGLNLFAQKANEFDVAVIVRGGGGTADLSWFDSQVLAELVARFPVPVLTGIGHFTNVSVVDLVAHHYLATPTAVAEFLIERVKSFNLKLDYSAKQIDQQSRSTLSQAQQKIDHYGLLLQRQGSYLVELAYQKVYGYYDLIRRESIQICIDNQKLIDQTAKDIWTAVKESLKNQVNRQLQAEKHLVLLDPKEIMKRGFSLTRFQGKSLKSIDQIKEGDQVETVLFRGRFKSSIDKLN